MLNPVKGQSDTVQLCKKKILTSLRMNKTGWVMMGSGGSFVLGGTLFKANLTPSESDGFKGSGNSDNELKITEANICISVGIGLIAGGIVMKSIGSRKLWYYSFSMANAIWAWKAI
jgi:hypothetical protein